MEKIIGVLDYGPKEMAESFRTVRKNSITIAEEIGEEHYDFIPAPGSRTVAKLLVHIAVTPRLQITVHGTEKRDTLEGFDFMSIFGGMVAEENAPRTKAQIVNLLREGGEDFATWLKGLTPDFLSERVQMPMHSGQPAKTRFEMILGVKEHEMHHRGQLMLIERMVGLVPHLTRAIQERMAGMQVGQNATA
jgi:uncharacterized damage-inducible protein DinB